MNTLTAERALLALVATWHRMPFESKTWARSKISSVSRFRKSLQDEVEEFFESLDDECPRQHSGTFEGSTLSGVILAAEEGFKWDSLPASKGEGQRWMRALAACCC